MIRPQLMLDLSNELIVDNFAGGGGASTGIELALGRHVDLAINHDPEAVALHTANHPQTRHMVEDVFAVDPLKETGGRSVGLAWFSPDCKHFSKAKGGKPRSKKIRGLAWVVVKWAAAVRPRVICLENVEEFRTWGPLTKDGNPCPLRKGKTFESWCARLRGLGYTIDWKELRACDYGAPTIRKRFFLVARCDGQPIVWPAPTHGAPNSPEVKSGKLKPWRTAAECIDWSIPCPSIFERTKPLAEATCRRIAKGIMRYVVNSAEPFIVNVANSKTTGRGPNVWPVIESVRTVTASPGFAVVTPIITEHANGSSPRNMQADEPMRTQCAEVKGGHFALCSAFLAKHYSGVVGAPVDGPVHTVTATDHHGLVAAHLTKFHTGSTGTDLHEPLHTVTAGGDPVRPSTGNPHGIVTAHVAKLRGDNVGHSADQPLHTVSAQGTHFAEVRAFLVKYYGTEQDPKLAEPLHTVTSRDRFGLVTIKGQDYAIVDIGLRMLAPRELYRAQGFPEDYNIGDDGRAGLKLSKSAQVRMCGNSVCPPMAAAIVKANVPELAAWFKHETKRIRRSA